MEREHYLWTAGGATVTVYLAADVINRLRAVISSPENKDAEIGGFLLGHRESEDRIVIEDFDILPSEHRRGMTFTLSAVDKRKLTQRMRTSHGSLEPLGSFRTHLRQGLYMDRYDFDLMADHFPASTDVMLLIRPVDWHAGFFIWEEGDISRQKSYHEFRFNPALLPLEAHRIPSTPPAAPRYRTAAIPSIPIPPLPTLMKVGLVAATLGLAAVLAFYTHEHRAPEPSPAVSLTTDRITPPPKVDSIKAPVDPDLNRTDNQYELHVKIPDRPSPFAKVDPRAPRSPEPVQSADNRKQSGTTPQPATPPEILPPSQVASLTVAPAPMPASLSAPVVLRPTQPTLVSEVSLEPSQPGIVRRSIRRVPVLNLLARHNYKSGTNFSPARPVRQVKPRLPEDVPQDPAIRPNVDVKVWIDETGQVTKTELLSNDVEPEVADIASNAAYKWTFKPAQLSDHPVSSEMVMHFHFVPKQNY